MVMRDAYMNDRMSAFLMDYWLLTFLIMGVLGALFGLFSFNLFVALSANVELIARYSIMALRDGAFLQLLELIAYGYASLFLYLSFKTCERALVARFAR